MTCTYEDYRQALENVTGAVRDGLLEEARRNLGLSYMETVWLDRQTCPDWA